MTIIKNVAALILGAYLSISTPSFASVNLQDFANSQWTNDYSLEYKHFNETSLEGHIESLQVFVDEDALEHGEEQIGWLVYTEDAVLLTKAGHVQSIHHKALPLEQTALSKLIFALPEANQTTLPPVVYRDLNQCSTSETTLRIFGHSQLMIDKCDAKLNLPKVSKNSRFIEQQLNTLLKQVKQEGIAIQ